MNNKSSSSSLTDYSPEISEPVFRFGEVVKREICEELHYHYVEDLRLEQYAERLGELMAMVHSMMVSSRDEWRSEKR